MAFRSVPFVHPAQSPRLADLFYRAEAGERIDMHIIGDSQESSNGRPFAHALAHKFALLFGNGLPATQWVGPSNLQLASGIITAINGTTNGDVPTSSLLPGSLAPVRLPSPAGNGFVGVLIPSSTNMGQPWFGNGEWWHKADGTLDTSGTFAEVLLCDATLDSGTTGTSVDGGWFDRAEPSTGYSWGSVVNTGTFAGVAMGGGWHRATTLNAPATWSVGPNQRIHLRSPTGSTCCFAAARMCRNVGGIAVTAQGDGGSQSNGFYVDASASGPHLAAFNPHIVALAYGTNDAFNGVTEAQFKTRMQGNIDLVRKHCPDALILLLGDVYRADADNDATYLGRRTEFEKYPRALQQLADEYADTLAINTYRWMVQTGSNAASENVDTTSASEWDVGTTYAQNAIVKVTTPYRGDVFADNGVTYWISTRGSNVGNEPGSPPASNHKQAFWMPLRRTMFDYVHATPMGHALRAEAIVQQMQRAVRLSRRPTVYSRSLR
jgi:lysophospholipase L1-like esterase